MLIETKVAGGDVSDLAPKETGRDDADVVDLMTALQRSVQRAQDARQGKGAKPADEQPAAKKATAKKAPAKKAAAGTAKKAPAKSAAKKPAAKKSTTKKTAAARRSA